MKRHWEAPPFFTSKLNGGEWSNSRPGERDPGRPTHWIGGWVVSRVSLEAVERRKTHVPNGNWSPAVQPIAIPTTELFRSPRTFSSDALSSNFIVLSSTLETGKSCVWGKYVSLRTTAANLSPCFPFGVSSGWTVGILTPTCYSVFTSECEYWFLKMLCARNHIWRKCSVLILFKHYFWIKTND
jgi:hypothetical protein